MDLKFNLHDLEPLILVHCLKDKSFFLKTHSSIKTDYFQDERLGKIFNVMSVYYNKYKTIPKLQTLNTLFKRKYKDKSSEYLDTIKFIFEYDENYDDRYIIDNTVNFIKQAKVVEAIKKSIPLIDECKYDQIYSEIKDAIVVDFDKDLGLNFEKNVMEVIKEEDGKRISTGYSQLDAVMCGGFEEKKLYVFSGIYGIGKSIWLQNIALKQLLNNKNVVYYTLELSDSSVVKRLASIFTKVAQRNFISNISDLEKQFKMLKMLTQTNLWIKEYPTRKATVNHFLAHLEELKAVHNFYPDIILVDYCNIMRNIERVSLEDTYVNTKLLYEDLRAFAQEIKLPVVTAAQINRGGMDEKKGGTKQLVTGANISDSLGIGMTADGHFVINQTAEEKMSSVMRLYVDKNRQGIDKITKIFGIDYECLAIDEDVQIIQ
jgi:replicative DNA helicase